MRQKTFLIVLHKDYQVGQYWEVYWKKFSWLISKIFGTNKILHVQNWFLQIKNISIFVRKEDPKMNVVA